MAGGARGGPGLDLLIFMDIHEFSGFKAYRGLKPIDHGSYYLYPLKIPDVRTFVLTFNAFGRWAPEAPIDQTLRFRLVRASGFPSPKKKIGVGFSLTKKKIRFF